MSVAQALLKCGHTVAEPPAGGGTFIVISDGNMCSRSVNNGQTWHAFEIISGQAGYLQFVKSNGDVWITSVAITMHRSTDNGVTWEGSPYSIWRTAANTGSTWYGFTASGDNGVFYKSIDNGATSIGTVFTDPEYTNAQCTGASGTNVIHFTSDQHAYRSTNSGSSFTKFTHYFTNAVDTKGSTWITAGGLVQRSTNNGLSFTTITVPTDETGESIQLFCIAANQTNNTWIAAGITSNGAYAIRSTDDGSTWTLLPKNLGSISPDIGAFRSIACSGSAWVITADYGQAWRSADNGLTWTQLPQGLNTGNTTVAFSVGANNI